MKTFKTILLIALLIGAILTIGSSCAPGTECESQLWYQDSDGDGFGNPDVVRTTCDQPQGYVSQAGDCDDTNPNVNPGANEITFNDIDDNCNGVIDECTTDADCVNATATYICIDGVCQIRTTYYADNDGDGFGDPSNTVISGETAPNGYVAWTGDCDDTNPNVNILANEIMGNGIDDNCNGLIDAQDVRYIDADGDGYGSPAQSAANGVFNNLDCYDSDANVHPYQNEIPGNGMDNNCDGIID